MHLATAGQFGHPWKRKASQTVPSIHSKSYFKQRKYSCTQNPL